MKVFFTSAYKYNHNLNPALWLKINSTSSASICTEDPDEADVIIFVESHPMLDPYFRNVIKNNIYRKYKSKCVLYHDADLSVTAMRTITPSIELWQYNPKHKRSGHYISRIHENEIINHAAVSYKTNPDYLYSFVGSETHFVRRAIFQMKHPINTFIKDTTGMKAWEMSETAKLLYERNYYDVINGSRFILCPRGIGPCSYRLFEAMQVGRVPVIISDEWVEMPGIDWKQFSIKVKEKDIKKIAEILDERKSEAVAMGKTARKHWENHFSPQVSLEQIATAASELVKNKYTVIDSCKDYLQFLKHPFHFKNLLRYKKNKLKKKYKLG